MKPIIVDVRDPSEYAKSHVENALNIPLGYFAVGIPDQLKYKPKDQPIIMYCNSGNRSGRAVESLLQYGFTDVTNGVNQATVQS